MPKTGTPEWLKKRLVSGDAAHETKGVLSRCGAITVCESSLCPNLNECFSRRDATFLILGSTCTRRCAFCAVNKAYPPLSPDPDEPARVAAVVRALGASYTVITSVTRDDLSDGGSRQFLNTIRTVKALTGEARIEVLVPDFGGRQGSLEDVMEGGPDVFGHNIETVRRLYQSVRPQADYDRSLGVLRRARILRPSVLIKSGLMVGLGESGDEILDTIRDIRDSGCDILTIGQYLRPNVSCLPAARTASPGEFQMYAVFARTAKFRAVASGPFVRSSYMASGLYDMAMKGVES